MAILSALPELHLPALQSLLRAVRYAEEGAEVLVVRLGDFQDAGRRRLLLAIHAASDAKREHPRTEGKQEAT
jgi:hypothetical protein